MLENYLLTSHHSAASARLETASQVLLLPQQQYSRSNNAAVVPMAAAARPNASAGGDGLVERPTNVFHPSNKQSEPPHNPGYVLKKRRQGQHADANTSAMPSNTNGGGDQTTSSLADRFFVFRANKDPPPPPLPLQQQQQRAVLPIAPQPVRKKRGRPGAPLKPPVPSQQGAVAAVAGGCESQHSKAAYLTQHLGSSSQPPLFLSRGPQAVMLDTTPEAMDYELFLAVKRRRREIFAMDNHSEIVGGGVLSPCSKSPPSTSSLLLMSGKKETKDNNTGNNKNASKLLVLRGALGAATVHHAVRCQLEAAARSSGEALSIIAALNAKFEAREAATSKPPTRTCAITDGIFT